MEKDKQRSANFTKSEINILIDFAVEHKNIIENKRTDGTTSAEKNKAWSIICEKFNAATGNFSRSTKTLRSKYDSLKKDLRKKCSRLRMEQCRTGGGPFLPTDLTPYEEKILSLGQTTFIGMNCPFDDDENGNKISNEEPIPLDEIEYLELETEDILNYVTEPKSSEGNKEENLIVKIDEPTPSTSQAPPATATEREELPILYRKQKRSEAQLPPHHGKNKKKSHACHCAADEAAALKIKLLKLQCVMVEKEMALKEKIGEKEMEQKEKITALQIKNLLLEQEIKKAELKKLL